MKTRNLLAVVLTLTFPIVVAQEKRPVATAGELKCLGFIHETELPPELIVSGTQEEGRMTVASEGTLIYVSGSGIASTKVGESLQVVRIQGKVREPHTRASLGVYYREVGSARIEALRGESAIARVTMGCDVIYKGDLLLRMSDIHLVPQPAVVSNILNPPSTTGVSTSIVLGKDDSYSMAAGDICFIGLGKAAGIKAGDRFTIYRVQPRFDSKDLIANHAHSNTSFEKVSGREMAKLSKTLSERKLPHQVLGDLVVLNVSCTTSSAMIVSSQREVLLGDLVIRQ
jgi:hypothetical protein